MRLLTLNLAMVLIPFTLIHKIPAQLWKHTVSRGMRAVVVDKPGPPESMRIAEDFPTPSVGYGQVLIQVAYAGINRADILQRLGRYPAQPGESNLMGLEVSGVVREANGPGRFRPGDRVMALLGGGGYAEYVNVSSDLVTRIPASLSLRDAAALPEAWLTAFQLLRLVANQRPGERVLVHAGASGVGTAAIQLSRRLFDGVPYATAGSAEKCAFALRLGAERCFNSREADADGRDWAAQLTAATNGVGANVILDCVGAAHLGANAKALARDGRWVLFGLLGGADMPQGASAGFLGEMLKKRGSLIASLLRDRSHDYKARLVSEFTEQALPLFEAGRLRPVIDSEFALSDVAAAHTKMQGNANVGKILLAVSPQLDLEKQHPEL